MSTKILDKAGLEYLWTKLKAYFAPKAHTHNAFETKHSYTVAANAAKNWYRIANANTSQTDTTKPIHAQFILTAYNASYDTGYYERWFVNAEVFGRNAHIIIFGSGSAPFSQARILYENTVADIDANDRPAIDLYLNYVLPNGTTKIEIEEVYNSGWTFVADGQLAASTIPTGFENVACSVRGNGVERSTYSDYTTYLNKPRREITANTTLADNSTYRSTTLNCTGTITITVPSLNSNYAWFFIKNANATSGVITVHPSTTSVLIDGSNANITLQPGEYVVIHSRAANSYSIIADGRWKSQKADKATTLAGYGITDAKIANGTITLGSNSITPLTSVPSHNQASDTITAMTGYSKPSSGSAITVSDSLNDAIGKLEARLDGASDGFPSGTRMLFQQSAAPTGWTKETGSGYDDIALRLTTGNVANKTDGKAFAACMAAGRATASATQGGTIGDKTAGGSISDTTAGGTVGNKALSVAMLASHDHACTYTTGGSIRGDYSFVFDWNKNHTTTGATMSSKTGSGSNHNHGFTGTEHGHTFTGTAHNHTFTGSAHSHTIDLDINYIDCIVASKA